VFASESSKDAVSVRIVVDVKSGIAELLAELGASVERASLPAGDYAVGAATIHPISSAGAATTTRFAQRQVPPIIAVALRPQRSYQRRGSTRAVEFV
jgi:hypothetical protein